MLGAAMLGSLAPSAVHAQAPRYPNQTIQFHRPQSAGRIARHGFPHSRPAPAGTGSASRDGREPAGRERRGIGRSVAEARRRTAPRSWCPTARSCRLLRSICGKTSLQSHSVLPTAMVARAPLFLAMHPKVPAKTLKELVDYVKANPGKLNYGLFGMGSYASSVDGGVQVGVRAADELYSLQGLSETIAALSGGHIDILFAAYAGLRAAVEGKKAVMIASNGPKRSPDAPEVPAIAELSPGFDLAVIQGVMGRVGNAEWWCRGSPPRSPQLSKSRRSSRSSASPVSSRSARVRSNTARRLPPRPSASARWFIRGSGKLQEGLGVHRPSIPSNRPFAQRKRPLLD